MGRDEAQFHSTLPNYYSVKDRRIRNYTGKEKGFVLPLERIVSIESRSLPFKWTLLLRSRDFDVEMSRRVENFLYSFSESMIIRHTLLSINFNSMISIISIIASRSLSLIRRDDNVKQRTRNEFSWDRLTIIGKELE